MDEFDFARAEVEKCRGAVKGGDYSKAIHALRLCAMIGIALPEWLASEAATAMRFYFAKGGSEGPGKRGGHLAQYCRDRKHRKRHHMAEWELARRAWLGGTREDAFERAAKRLLGTTAFGTREEIEKSFNKINREYKMLAASRGSGAANGPD